MRSWFFKQRVCPWTAMSCSFVSLHGRREQTGRYYTRSAPATCGIPVSYTHRYAKEYSLIRDMDDFVAADEIEKNETQDYYYPIDKEYQIINYIKTGDGAHAKATLEEIYEANLNQATDSMKCRLLFYNILSTLMKTPGSQQDYSAMEAQLLRQIDSGDLREAQRQIEQFVDALCVQFGQELENRDGRIVSDVVKFMKENFSDVDLNVSAIADTFHMAPPYLSKKFRQETGESVLDYPVSYTHLTFQFMEARVKSVPVGLPS